MRAILLLICALAWSACSEVREPLAPEAISPAKVAPGDSTLFYCHCTAGYDSVSISTVTPGLTTVTRMLAQRAWVRCNTDGFAQVTFFLLQARVGSAYVLECGQQDDGLCVRPQRASTSLRFDCGSQLEPAVTATVGQPIFIPVAGGAPQYVYVTDPNSETVSNIAHFITATTGVSGTCSSAGDAWVKVLTGNGYWKISPLTCVRHDQGSG